MILDDLENFTEYSLSENGLSWEELSPSLVNLESNGATLLYLNEEEKSFKSDFLSSVLSPDELGAFLANNESFSYEIIVLLSILNKIKKQEQVTDNILKANDLLYYIQKLILKSSKYSSSYLSLYISQINSVFRILAYCASVLNSRANSNLDTIPELNEFFTIVFNITKALVVNNVSFKDYSKFYSTEYVYKDKLNKLLTSFGRFYSLMNDYPLIMLNQKNVENLVKSFKHVLKTVNDDCCADYEYLKEVQ